MAGAPLDNPILNSAFRAPERHFELTDEGEPTGIIKPGRRPSIYLMPIPKPRKRRNAFQQELELEERVTENPLVNLVREHVNKWRALPASEWGVTYETERLLTHWRNSERENPLFFCQVEAAETIIWLTEVAKAKAVREIWGQIEDANAEANPDLLRVALKMATGSGKTTVMAMLIAWHAVNKARRPSSKLFSDAFLIVTPGITIRDRLRVLLPSDPQNYYETRNLVPRDMLDDIRKARIVIANYHQFKLRETLKAPKLTKEILQGRKPVLPTTETDGQMLQRVCAELMQRRNIVVINDEAHHCYRHKAGEEEEPKPTGEEKEEAKKNAEAARIWISGLEAAKRKLGIDIVYDLSATPFFLRGSGYQEGTLFPWVVSDFSLMDAIEAGIVKVPRVPVSDDQVGGDLPIYRNVYRYITLPRKGRAKQKETEGGLDPEQLPAPLLGALNALYGHYAKVFDLWQKAGQGTPPVFIVVCNNTSVSKIVYDYIAGYDREDSGQTVTIPGKLPLFRNVEDGKWLARPRTLLIDSEQLDSGEAMSSEFKRMASHEIEEFKRELSIRFGSGAAEDISDEDLLREVMNTVGKPGKLGEQVRCVVSVSMLTEGWDANTVTHILGVRAFGTQLLCEQVVGRGLRRVSYDPDPKTGLLEAEYADVLGVPFTFAASHVVAAPKPPKPRVHVEALDERAALEIRFPRVLGYRVVFPTDRLEPRFTDNSRLVISPDDNIAMRTDNEAIIGEGTTLTLDTLRSERASTVAFHVAGHALRSRFRDEEGNLKPYLFPQLLHITRQWMSTHLVCQGNTVPQLLLWRYYADLAAERIYTACVPNSAGRDQLRPILDPYNPEGSSRHVDFQTSKETLHKTRPEKCHVNYVVCDSEWEAGFAETVEHMDEVLAYVKNENLGFEVPYVLANEERRYRPDYILRVAVPGAQQPLNLVVEIKGFRGRDAVAKADTMKRLWVPAVNNAALGWWGFVEVTEKYGAERTIRDYVTSIQKKIAA